MQNLAIIYDNTCAKSKMLILKYRVNFYRN